MLNTDWGVKLSKVPIPARLLYSDCIDDLGHSNEMFLMREISSKKCLWQFVVEPRHSFINFLLPFLPRKRTSNEFKIS